MITYVSLLRGINVGGHRKVSMAELKRLYTTLGFSGVTTYLQSGNVVFGHSRVEQPALERYIQNVLKERLGLDISVIIRTASDLHKLVENNPFKAGDEGKLYVTFLSSRPKELQADMISKAVSTGEAYSISGSEIYLVCPNGYGRTRLTNTFFERVFVMPATTRNWKTLNALASIAE